MNVPAEFMQHTRSRYIQANGNALDWQLERMSASNALINTKINSISLLEYSHADGNRGPDFIYGWIQGRGLEAMVTQATYFQTSRPELSRRLDKKAIVLYNTLSKLYSSQNGAYFCYDKNIKPICFADANGLTPQHRQENISTYADIFVTKGLIAAASRFAQSNLAKHLDALDTIIDAINHDRFLMSESLHITDSLLKTQPLDFGPRMIALGAAALLHQLDLAEYDTFSAKFIDHILTHHVDLNSGLVANQPGGHVCNIGHGIEFAGFALDIIRQKAYAESTASTELPSTSKQAMITDFTASTDLTEKLSRVITSSFSAGFNGIGIQLSVDISSMTPIDVHCPWWSLPETIRAAALAYEATGETAMCDIWRTTDEAFFTNFWRLNPPIAYQMLTSDGPVDSVPATPDLDPGYHTGLSLLAAIEAADRMLKQENSI